MAHVTEDRVRETTTTTGTGALTLAGAVVGFRTFASVLATADTCWYAVQHQAAAEWETGLATLGAGGVLERTTVVRSSNANAAVSFSAGTKDVFLTALASSMVQRDNQGAVPLIAAAGTPSTPAAGILKLFARERANRLVPGFVGPSGVDTLLQPALWGNRIAMVTPARTTAINNFGCGVQTGATLSHPTIGTGSLADSIYRTRFSTTTTAGNAAGVRSDQLALRGNATARGGFYFAARFCSGSIALAGGQVVVGLQGSNGALAGEPSAFTNLLAVGKDIADTQWQFMHNDGTGAATKVSLGVTQAVNQTFDLRIFCPPGGSTIGVLVEQIANDGSATTLLSTDLTTDIPTTTALLAMHCQVRNGATAAAANVDLARMYIESDF